MSDNNLKDLMKGIIILYLILVVPNVIRSSFINQKNKRMEHLKNQTGQKAHDKPRELGSPDPYFVPGINFSHFDNDEYVGTTLAGHVKFSGAYAAPDNNFYEKLRKVQSDVYIVIENVDEGETRYTVKSDSATELFNEIFYKKD